MQFKHWRVPTLSPFKGFLHFSITSFIAYAYVICVIFYMCKQINTKLQTKL